jgi:hypothetical protein
MASECHAFVGTSGESKHPRVRTNSDATAWAREGLLPEIGSYLVRDGALDSPPDSGCLIPLSRRKPKSRTEQPGWSWSLTVVPDGPETSRARSQILTHEATTMDATRKRRTKDQVRQAWYAGCRQRRFARFLGFGGGEAASPKSPASPPGTTPRRPSVPASMGLARNPGARCGTVVAAVEYPFGGRTISTADVTRRTNLRP